MRARFTLFVGVTAAILTLILSGMTANSVYDLLFKVWCPDWEQHRVAVAVGFIGLLTLSFITLYLNRRVFQPVRSLKYGVCTKPVPFLIMFLSPPYRKDVVLSDEPLSIAVGDKMLPSTIEQDIALLAETNWPWQQMMRGLHVHAKDGTLKHIYLIGSADTPSRLGSFKSLKLAEALIKHYYPSVSVRPHPVEVHFEDFNALVESLNIALRTLKKKPYTEKDFVIDVTGGQKTTSIAGAIVTINRGITFQYVQTDKPYEVLVYDVVMEHAPMI